MTDKLFGVVFFPETYFDWSTSLCLLKAIFFTDSTMENYRFLDNHYLREHMFGTFSKHLKQIQASGGVMYDKFGMVQDSRIHVSLSSQRILFGNFTP